MAKYPKNFLSGVVLRIDFSGDVTLGDLNEFGASITDLFPSKEARESVAGFEINFINSEVRQQKKVVYSWLFKNASEDIFMDIGSNYLTIECKKYPGWEKMSSMIARTVIPLLNQIGVKTAKRIGLRYLNEIDLAEPEPINWEDLLAESLIGPLRFARDQSQKIARGMSQLIIKLNGADLAFNFGVWNPDYPNPVTRKQFVLDLDCYTILSSDTDELTEKIAYFHTQIENLFEASITETLRIKLRGE